MDNPNPSLMREFWDFLRVRKRYWMLPIFIILGLISALIIFTEGSAVGVAELRLEVPSRAPRSQGELEEGAQFRFHLPDAGVSLKEAEKELILAALDRTHWVQKDAARLLGITKRAIHYKIEQHGITHPTWAKNRPKTGEDAD